MKGGIPDRIPRGTQSTATYKNSTYEDETIFLQSHTDPLSNFLPCRYYTVGKVFKSSEYALQWAKAMEHGRDDLAEMIRNAPTEAAAKKIGDTITKTARWLEREADVMLEILNEKIEQCYVFRQVLISSIRRTLVEDTNNPVWRCGPDGKWRRSS